MKYFIIIFVLSISFHTVIAQAPNQMPVYPGCEQVDHKMECFKEKLLNFIAEKFNSDLLQKVKDQTEVRMLISFVINEEGKLEQIKINSPYDFLNNEMLQIINRLPVFIPARSDDIPVRMQYELPVVFEVKIPTD